MTLNLVGKGVIIEISQACHQAWMTAMAMAIKTKIQLFQLGFFNLVVLMSVAGDDFRWASAFNTLTYGGHLGHKGQVAVIQ